MPDSYKTRSAKSQEEDENLIKRVVEKIFASEDFLCKLVDKISVILNQQVENTVKVCTDKVEQLDKKIMDLSKQIDDQEQFSRRNNLRIYGLVEDRNENVPEKLTHFFKNKLDINVNTKDMDFCYRLKRKEGANTCVIVRFCNNWMKQEIFKNKRKLKGSKIVIKEDLTIRRAAVYKQACVKFGPRNVWSSEGKVVCKVNDKIYKFCSLTDLNI